MEGPERQKSLNNINKTVCLAQIEGVKIDLLLIWFTFSILKWIAREKNGCGNATMDFLAVSF